MRRTTGPSLIALSFASAVTIALPGFSHIAEASVATPLVVNGFNTQVVASTGYIPPSDEDFDTRNNAALFVSGSQDSTSTPYNDGLPTTGAIASATGNATYQLQSYTANNALQILPGATGTLAFSTSPTLSQLDILAASANEPTGNATGTVTLNFVGGGTAVFSYNADDWYDPGNNTEPAGIYNLGRGIVDEGSSSWSYDTGHPSNFALYETNIALPLIDQQAISSLVFTPAPNGASINGEIPTFTNVFAVSGVIVPEPATGALFAMAAFGLLCRRRA